MVYGMAMKRYVIYITVVVAAFFIAMVQHFAHSARHFVSEYNTTEAIFRDYTGIVVATGGDGRIQAGLGLMLEAKAPRLLISGTGIGVRKADIIRIANHQNKFDASRLDQIVSCCVDLDTASNTLANAQEAAQWSRQHNLTQLILVTSDFHMPRALRVFRDTMPNRVIIAHAVPTTWLQPNQYGAAPWWKTSRRIEIISREMLKYYANLI